MDFLIKTNYFGNKEMGGINNNTNELINIPTNIVNFKPNLSVTYSIICIMKK